MYRAWILLLVLGGCGEPPSSSAEDAGPDVEPEHVPVAAPVVRQPEPRIEVPEPIVEDILADQSIAIPAGPFLVGSPVGAAFREPRDEADLIEVDLGAFRIDRLPYPNDPDQPMHTRVTRAEAAHLCELREQRLCTEIEWERACKGDDSARLFATGPTFDPAQCDDPMQCASPEGVLMMGARAGEWTSSDGNRGLDASTAIFRGAAVDPEGLYRHRCASRRTALPATRSAHLGFRCCSGPAQTASYPTEPSRQRFRKLTPTTDEVRAWMRSVPELERFADAFVPFDEEQMQRAVDRGEEGLRGWELTGGAFAWSPGDGEEARILAGQTGTHSLIALLYVLPDGTLQHASSFVLQNENVPIAVAFTPPSNDELLWSACWGCLGEGGSISRREDNTLAILHR